MPISNRDTAVVVETNDLSDNDDSLYIFHVVKESDKDKVQGGALGVGRVRKDAHTVGDEKSLVDDLMHYADSFLPFALPGASSTAIPATGKLTPQGPKFILKSRRGVETEHSAAVFGVFGVKNECPMSVFCFSSPEEHPIVIEGFTGLEVAATATNTNYLSNRDFSANLHAHGDQ